jgi:hypothetical protein
LAILKRVTRRRFIRDLGISTAAIPFVMGLPSLGLAKTSTRKQRLVIMFSPNGQVPVNFWPDEQGGFWRRSNRLKSKQ